MAVTNVVEKAGKSRRTSGDLTAIVRRFAVTSNVVDEAEGTIETASYGGIAIPEYYAEHPSDSRLHVKEIECDQSTENRLLWEVTVSYDGPRADTDIEEPEEPTSLEPTIHWGTQKVQEGVDRDIYGNKIQNTVGEDFDPPLQRNKSYRTLAISRYEAYATVPSYDDYLDTVNSSVFFGYQPGDVYCESINGERVLVNGIYYYHVTYEFIINTHYLNPTAMVGNGWVPGTSAGLNTPSSSNAGGWVQRVANRGRRRRDTDPLTGAAAYIAIKDGEGDAITEPAGLDYVGQPLAQNEATLWLGFEVYERRNFADLQLE